jgi:hypothetical protein
MGLRFTAEVHSALLEELSNVKQRGTASLLLSKHRVYFGFDPF